LHESFVGDKAEGRTLQNSEYFNERVPGMRGAVQERDAAEGDDIWGGGQKLAVSKFDGAVALAAEQEAADEDEKAEGIFGFFGRSEGIMEDDEDVSEANSEEAWVADLVPDDRGGEVAEQSIPETRRVQIRW
jgi:hypothetical protein